jgi:hypothetical protein
VKKLADLSHGKFYRAKLDDADRLLFSLVRHGDEVCALMLEIIVNHDYDKSRFLRGAAIDETKISEIDTAEPIDEARSRCAICTRSAPLFICSTSRFFDDTQEAVYRLPPPLIVVGSAGSGKTALTLKSSKHVAGEVPTSPTPPISPSARDIYYANGFERDGQEAQFLSYREFVESIRVPARREALWRDFAALVCAHAAGVQGCRRAPGVRGNPRRACRRRRRYPDARRVSGARRAPIHFSGKPAR